MRAPLIRIDALPEDLDFDRFLRERGIFGTEGDFEVFESLIPVGCEVEVKEKRGVFEVTPI